MKNLKKCFSDIKKYSEYLSYSTKSLLESEFTNSYLKKLWLVLGPLSNVLIYYFLFGIIFNGSEQYFLLFLTIGFTYWSMFSNVVNISGKMVRKNKNILNKIYMPKFLLIVNQISVSMFKMSISFIIIVVMIFLYNIPLTLNILWILPLSFCFIIVTFGLSCIIMHISIMFGDFEEIIKVILKLTMYMTGIFYSIETRVPAPYNSVLAKANPIAFIIISVRKCIIYGSAPDSLLLLIWMTVGILISIVGINIIYKYENNYLKII